ncbi:SGNH/GDSL hydrolase family protein [Tautonia marina]|uniref:SGNH/GDSL hydrolase family protein n=1 Tax=Tautonia marina TaxID=2653855 RepID=UPI00191BCF12|nr:SGNH/GDSL hydrolase family protein [Tautonia marina]
MNHRIGCALVALAGLLFSGQFVVASDRIDPGQATVRPDDPTRWYDVRLLGLEGQGWTDTKAPFDRLPARAEGVVRDPVWSLSRHSAGLCVRFVTDAPTIRAHWTLISDRLDMPHMPATGVSGLDLYARVDDQWYWVGVGFPNAVTNTVTLASGLPPEAREYLLYLPLYNGVESVEIGLPEGTSLAKAPARPEGQEQPIVVYGTSITQGGCASRPGMVHTAILGRRFNRPVINLGFSGNGRMEAELAELLAEIDPAVYVIDCLPNMNAEEVEARVEPFVRILRAARPETPIVLAEDRTYTNARLIAAQRERNQTSRAALRAAFDRLVASGVKGLTYLPGDPQLGDDGEATVDGSHPTDLGFLRMANAFEPALRPLLTAPEHSDARENPATGAIKVPDSLQDAFRPPTAFEGDEETHSSPLIFSDGRRVRSVSDWRERRQEILETWHGIMGAWPPLIEAPTTETLGTELLDGFEQRTVRIEVAPEDRTLDGYLLVPEGEGPFPAMLVVFYEPGTAIGEGNPVLDFARQLAKRGFVALSLGIDPSAVTPEAGRLGVQPLSYLAFMAANTSNAMVRMPEIDPKRIGVMGHSYGGKWALFASCLHEPFACGVWSDPGIVFDESRPNVNYWEPWYLGWEPDRTRPRGVISPESPRTGSYKQLIEEGRDLHELHALMAPRPFLVSGGSEDPPERWRALNHSIAVNRILGSEHRVAMTNRPGHRPTEESNEQIFQFLDYVLKP